MTPIEFVHWFKGYLEVSRASTMDVQAMDVVKKKLDEVITETRRPSLMMPTVFNNDVPPSDFGVGR